MNALIYYSRPKAVRHNLVHFTILLDVLPSVYIFWKFTYIAHGFLFCIDNVDNKTYFPDYEDQEI